MHLGHFVINDDLIVLVSHFLNNLQFSHAFTISWEPLKSEQSDLRGSMIYPSRSLPASAVNSGLNSIVFRNLREL